jgi:hypothetical protein
MLREPQRTEALEAFNDRFLAAATMQLMLGIKPFNVPAKHSVTPIDLRTQIATLLDHLSRTSPCYALWLRYAKEIEPAAKHPSWDEIVASKYGNDPSKNTNSEAEYALLIGQLGQLLVHFRDDKLPLPPLLYERIWFLDQLRGPERNLQARAVVQGLIEAIKPCASA